jgi:phosphate transport system permease protein
MSQRERSFTGRKRSLTNRRWVRLADRVAQWFITISGIGTIVAVLLVFVFLLSVVLPLFWPGTRVLNPRDLDFPGLTAKSLTDINEYRQLGWSLSPQGKLVVFRADQGETLQAEQLWEDGDCTALVGDSATGEFAAGFRDGSVRLGRVNFVTSFLSPDELPEEVRASAPAGDPSTWPRAELVRSLEGGVVEWTTSRQWRRQSVEVTIGSPLKLQDEEVVTLEILGARDSDGMATRGPTFAAATKTGRIHVATTKSNPLTGEMRLDESWELNGTPQPTVPLRLLINARGGVLWAVYHDGLLQRWSLSAATERDVMESVRVNTRSNVPLSAAAWALGRETVVLGDSRGEMTAWCLTRNPAIDPQSTDGSDDGLQLLLAHRFPGSGLPGAEVTTLTNSPRSRLMVVGDAAGTMRLIYLTTDKTLATVAAPAAVMGASARPKAQPLDQIIVTPKQDAILAISGSNVRTYDLLIGHPEVSLRSLFRPVFYEGEGFTQPEHVYQSSSSGVESEMKLGLWPLVFGTLKATFYSLLFGAPIAFLAAIHTSEFLSTTARARVKPVIEMMAGLPSVVLGFMAALVLAPLVEQSIATLITCLFTVPLCISLGATLWTLKPNGNTPRRARWRLPLIIASMVLGVVMGSRLSGWLEQWLFQQTLIQWLDNRALSGLPGWFLLLLPLALVTVVFVVQTNVNPWLMRRFGDRSHVTFALLNQGKMLLGLLAVLLLAGGVAWLLTMVGSDPRGTILGSYVQRNAMVVGFVMGFAIIPLIYTLADDALTAVPQHLRAASLGAGATPWQTAVRIVVPTAMSGLFSALMIGLGRAVGETMIVLMAGGNTAMIDWNPFNGFRTLSANIAVELPEAPAGQTHFRTLYLAALTLLLLTFVVNTAAELVRTRYRKRASSL